MNNQEFMIWKAKLIQLTPDQRNKLISSMKTLGLHEETVFDDWLIQGLIMALRKNGLASVADTPRLLKSSAFKSYKACSAQLLKKLSKVTLNSSSSKSSLAYLCGLALIRWCKKHCVYPVKGERNNVGITVWMHKPITAALVLSNSKNLLLALEEQFPGYLEANILHVIVNKKRRVYDRQVKWAPTRVHPHTPDIQQSRRGSRRRTPKS